MSVGPDIQKPLSYFFEQKREGEFQALPLAQTELVQGLADIVLPRVSSYLTGGAQRKDQVLRGKYYYESRFSQMREFLETILDSEHLQESYVAAQKNKDELVVWSAALLGSELHITLNKREYEIEYNLRRSQPEKPEFYPDSPVVLVSQPQPELAQYSLGIKQNRHDEPFGKSRRLLSNQGKIPDSGLEYLRTLAIVESTIRAVTSRGSALSGEQESSIQSVSQFTKPVSYPLFDDQSPYSERRMEMLDAVRESLLAIEASHVTMEETTQAALQILRRNRNQVAVIEETGEPVAKDAIDTVGIQIGKDTRLVYVVVLVDQQTKTTTEEQIQPDEAQVQQEKEQTRREKPGIDAVAALHSKSATLKIYLVKNDTITEINTEKNSELIRSYEDVWTIRTDLKLIDQ